MPKKIKIHQTVSIYSNHEESAKTSNFLNEGQIVDFNREKRRNGINWMEIYLDNEKKYIKKDFSKIFILKEGKLADNSCNVLFWESNDNENYKFDDIFSPVQNEANSLEEIEIRRIYDDGKKEKWIRLYYDKENANVYKTVLYKKDKITISAEKINFLEVFSDKKTGYILSDVSYDETKDWWMMPLIILIISLVTIGIFIAVLLTGWIVVGPILLIPGFIVAIVVIVFMQIFIAIVSAIFKSIRKRF
ncbi:hypothetical protein AB670_01781 [Chryseobacterium sp. MOF25P]|uniref:ABC transporter ATP-binding protein n=1 Tax=unclassified Chryseobacterium TaxID=2593645 RepID=UPI000805F415|nr:MULTISPECIES: ABC transporter ATP-binding protein [unclassified Chryseobacterium]OBW41830.1 hypothetical protein AB670_01781 [Chryseobacterium sp. MOF25P]OBW43617.1 hypothetical protein AB671_04320 [Chryseobacterium sp. BGARF1]